MGQVFLPGRWLYVAEPGARWKGESGGETLPPVSDPDCGTIWGGAPRDVS